ncbi:MAG TPA: ABC transporter permease [Thermoanaerobaculia bacterium]|nr:ABC transporter permease [Thermoanaerobaculia bacterium]
MRPLDLFRFSGRAVSGHRLRSALSLLGVAIGVAAVIVLTALGEGARRYVVDEFASLGTNLLAILPGRTETTGAMPGVVGVPNDLTLDDARAIATRVRLARNVAPVSIATETVARGELSRQVAVIGTAAGYREVIDFPVARGQFLPEGDFDRGAPVVVLGYNVAKELFGSEDPIGQVVRIGAWRMRVIGVNQQVGTKAGANLDEVVFVPVATALSMFNRTSLFRILVRTHTHADIETARAQVREILIERHGEEDFSSLTEEALASTFSSILTALTLVLAAIAAISLSVAGLGIMNVMLVSVSERTSEVGLMRAVGVSRRQVAVVFLLEAVLLSGLGGLVGLGTGYLVVRLLVSLYPALPASPPVWAVVAAVVVSLAVGAFFGWLPARRAARLDPVLALGRR